MMTDDDAAKADEHSSERVLSPEAQRALDEAAQRRAEARRRQKESGADAASEAAPREIGGREGPDPTRYGDWEKKGLISDF